jgi:hypothetical protein
MLTEILDRSLKVQRSTIDDRTDLRIDRADDLLRAHRPEQTAAITGLRCDRDRLRNELGGDLLGISLGGCVTQGCGAPRKLRK